VDGSAHDRLGDGELLDLIRRWQEQLVLWAQNGQLIRAARVALNLPDPHPGLEALMARISAADLHDLPPILPLNWEEMEGSACAYAPERQLILINREWLDNAVAEQVFAVLTEQLGHHLDVLFNPVDTPGDEGERFLEVLRCSDGNPADLTQFAAEEPHGVVHLHGETIAVDEAGAGAFCLDLRDLPHPSDPTSP
jgi:hypothetical protein